MFLKHGVKPPKKAAKIIDNGSKSGIIKSLKLDDLKQTLSSGGVDEKLASEIHKVLEKRKADRLFSASKLVKIDPVIAMQTIASMNGVFSDITLNINENFFRGKTLKEIDEVFKKSDSTVANSLFDGIVHEEYHARLIDGLSYGRIEALYDELSDIHISGISPIALSDGAECIAETGVLLARGEKENIPQEALDLFKKYLGGNI